MKGGALMIIHIYAKVSLNVKNQTRLVKLYIFLTKISSFFFSSLF
ncbi:hypothetical protein SPONN_1691 [uncultured Candidatus Thioglobus sp.]|nr:hypothetical protein SPONN_1691 [uncultured Candidatus Thioglobus sp.]